MIYKSKIWQAPLQKYSGRNKYFFDYFEGLFWQKMNVILHQTNEKYNFTKKSEKYSFFFLENLEIKKQTCIFAFPNKKGSKFSISKLGV